MKWSSWIEVNLDSLAHNYNQLVSLTTAELCPVVKSDAYGHGAPVVVRFLHRLGAKLFAVSSVEEALTIRELSQAPLLLLTPPLHEQIPLVIKHRLIPTIESAEQVSLFERAADKHFPLPVHLKVDTGLGRLGIKPNDAVALGERIARSAKLQLAGVFTHFAEGSSSSRTARQLRTFLAVKEAFAQAGLNNLIWHAANSAAFCLGPHTHLDMVRIGTLLYGQGKGADELQLKETWALYAKVISVRRISAGSSVGYGGTYKAHRDMLVGVVPIGYSDGFTMEPQSTPAVQTARVVSRIVKGEKPQAFVDGQPVAVVGKAAMNLTILDLSAVPHPSPGLPVRLIARRASINRDLPKVYLKDGKPYCTWWNGRLYHPSAQPFDRTHSNLYDRVRML